MTTCIAQIVRRVRFRSLVVPQVLLLTAATIWFRYARFNVVYSQERGWRQLSKADLCYSCQIRTFGPDLILYWVRWLPESSSNGGNIPPDNRRAINWRLWLMQIYYSSDSTAVYPTASPFEEMIDSTVTGPPVVTRWHQYSVTLHAARFVGLLSAVQASWWLLVTARRLKRREYCDRCGYCLRGCVSGVCPECGSAIAGHPGSEKVLPISE